MSKLDLPNHFQVICGTRMIPAPNMKDVFMDLQADHEQFLHGKAHKGMANGAKNILVRILTTSIRKVKTMHELKPEGTFLLFAICYLLFTIC